LPSGNHLTDCIALMAEFRTLNVSKAKPKQPLALSFLTQLLKSPIKAKSWPSAQASAMTKAKCWP
jgi:hypothetical protein